MGRRDRQATRLPLRAPPLEELAEDEVRGDGGADGRRLHRSTRRTCRPRCAARRLRRGKGLRVCRQGRHRVRHQAAARASIAAECARDPEVAVHESHGAAAHPRTLGAPGDRRQGGVHRMDGARQAAAFAAARGRLVITHPEKMMFPEDGITKGDLAAYYEAVAPAMLPHIARRPVTMERYPAGIGKKGFWQKDVSKGFPAWLERVEVPKKDGVVHHPVVTDLQSLLWVTNQNTITHHVWTSRVPDLNHPDVCVFDLDPSDDNVADVRAAAIGLRDLLDKLGLPSWIKTTGSKGFHILVPLDGKATMGTAARFANTVGTFFVSLAPDRLTQEFAKSDRHGRIYMDTGRNGYHSTFAAAYTVRARPGATVSAPCTWEEVERGEVNPQSFTLRNVPDRVARIGDLW